MPLAGSIGRGPRDDRRGCRRSDARALGRPLTTPPFAAAGRCAVDHASGLAVVFGAAFVRRIEGPVSSRRWATEGRASQQRVFLRAMLVRSTYARHRIRHGIRHAAARAWRRSHPCVANDRLRYMLIGYARVSKADGSQPLDLQRDALRAA